jgi:hypothetical protein
VALLPEALQPHFATVSAQLYLKVNEPEKAFPFIEQLGASNQRLCKELANEFLRVWTRMHDPNADTSGRTNRYMFMFGFDQRANGIPLTRSKQQRNLAELGQWVERLRRLPIGGVDEQLLTQAFVGGAAGQIGHGVQELARRMPHALLAGAKDILEFLQGAQPRLVHVRRGLGAGGLAGQEFVVNASDTLDVHSPTDVAVTRGSGRRGGQLHALA